MLRSNVRRGACSVAAAAGVIALGLGAAAPANAIPGPDGSTVIDLVNITDLHGALVQGPNIAAQVEAIRAANIDTVFSSAGDSIGGSTFESAIDGDVPTLDVLDAAGLDVSAVGNHEFDQGFADLTDRVQPMVEFPYLGANVIDEATGEPALPPIEIVTTDSGATVGYIGTVTQQTPSVVSGDGIEGLEFTDPVAVTNEWAAILSDGIDTPENPEADVVVALAHEATEIIAPGLSDDVDVAFTGHSHTQRIATTPSGAPVVQAEAAGTFIARVTVTLAEDGAVSATPGTLVPVEEFDPESTGPTDPAQFQQASADIVRAAYADAAELGDQVVGTIGAPFNAASNTGEPNVGTPQHRGAESPLNNLIAQVALETVNGFGLEADFGIMNPGGIRSDLDPNEDGVVTYREAFNVTSFSNTIGTKDYTGAQVDTLLEQQFIGQGARPMLILGLSPELNYFYDPTAPIGERVTDIFLNGAPIDPTATYRIASNTFLLGGEDGFTVLDEGTNLQESGVVDWQATGDFLSRPENADLMPSYQQQSLGVTYGTDLTQAIAPGEDVTIDLSSLSFTGTEPQAELVTAYVLGSNLPSLPSTTRSGTTAAGVTAESDLVQPAAEPGTVLAEVAVDNTNVVDANETGRASVTITVPEDTVDGQFFVAYEVTGEGVPTDGIVLEFTVAADAQPPVSPEPTNPTPTAPAPTDPPVDGGDDQAGPGEGTLPETGAELAAPLAIVAMLVLLAGLGLVLRRRTV